MVLLEGNGGDRERLALHGNTANGRFVAGCFHLIVDRQPNRFGPG